MSANNDDDDNDDDDFDNAKNYSSNNFVEAVKPEKIIFFEDLNRLFPKIEEVFKEEEEGKIKNKITFLNYDNIMKKIE